MTKVANSGDVVVLDFPGVTGTKRRPVVIVSSPVYHKERPDIIVGLITSQTSTAVAATDYLLQDWASANLRRASAFRSFLTTIPRFAITAHIGQLSPSDWKAVRERVQIALAQP